MKKTLLALVIILPVLLIALYLFGGIVLGKVAKAGVEAFVPQMTKTSVAMDDLDVSPLTGSGNVHGFILGNPEGFKSDYAIAFERAHLDVAPFSILGDRILIEKVHIYAPKFNYEKTLTSSNIQQILKNVKAAAGRPPEPGEEPPAEVEEVKTTGLKIEIKELIIDEGQVSMSVAGATVPAPLPKIVLRDLGTAKGGIPPDEMAFEVMSVVLQQVIQAGVKSPGSTVDTIKGLFGGGKKDGDGEG